MDSRIRACKRNEMYAAGLSQMFVPHKKYCRNNCNLKCKYRTK